MTTPRGPRNSLHLALVLETISRHRPIWRVRSAVRPDWSRGVRDGDIRVSTRRLSRPGLQRSVIGSRRERLLSIDLQPDSVSLGFVEKPPGPGPVAFL